MIQSNAHKSKRELAGSRVKIRFGRHILPFLAGGAVFLAVFGFFNSELLIGQIAYGIYSHQANVHHLDEQLTTQIVDPNAAPRIVINKINVTAPVNFTETRVNEYAFLQDLHNGVVHYPGTAMPGQQGNVVIFGHSSGQWWAPGNYKFVFTLLDKLVYGDQIFIEYKGTRYIYRVYNTFVIPPTDMSVLNQGGNHMLTLLTCTPVGTDTNRLVIQAQQIAPHTPNDTTFTKPAILPASTKTQQQLPGNTSFWDDFTSLLHDLFKR